MAWAYSHIRNGLLRTRRASAGPQPRDRSGLAADRRGLDEVRIHPGVHVGVGAGVVALVVHRTLRVAAVHPVRHLGQVDAGAGLVAERPDDHAGMVLVPLHGALDPVQVGRRPARVVARVVLSSRSKTKPWVSRSHSSITQKPSSSARSSTRGMRRVVAGPDRVDAGLLHHDQIGAGVILVEDPAALRMGLVSVHPAEDHLAPVDRATRRRRSGRCGSPSRSSTVSPVERTWAS